MTTSLFSVISNQQVGTTNPPTVAAVAPGKRASYMFTNVTFCNANTTTEEIYVWILPSGTVPTATNYIHRRKILAGKWHSMGMAGDGLYPGESLYAATDTADVVNLRIFGAKESD